MELELAPKAKRAKGDVCCVPTVSHHLKVLREAGLVGSEKQGLWAYYHVLPGAVDELAGWLA